MKVEEKEQLRIKIEEAISETGKKIEQLKETTQPISPENAIGRISRMDAINNKSVSEAALHIAKRKLAGLKLALAKLDSPDFGICTRCRQPIPLGRLMYLPESSSCVRCADK